MDEILNFFRSVPESPQGLLDFITSLLFAYGYLVIFLGSALDNFGLPSSGDIVMFAGGFFANDGQISLSMVMLVGFLGANVSDNAVYWIGRIGGRPLRRLWLRRPGRPPHNPLRLPPPQGKAQAEPGTLSAL